MIYGCDYLGAVNFEKAMLRSHPVGWCAGIMPETFKNSKGNKGWGTVNKMGRSKRFSEIVLHLTPFDYDHEYPIKKNIKLLRQNTTKVNQLQQKYPHTRFLPSPFCEHRHDRNTIENVIEELRTIAPLCTFVNSIYGGQETPLALTEIHLSNSKKLPKKPKFDYLVSFDGFGGDKEYPGDFTDTDIEAILEFYHDARQIRSWNFRMNGKYGHLDKTILAKRKHWPDENYLRGHHAMMKKREGNTTWPETKLYKPFADDHGAGGKDNKAMCILPINKPFVTVFDFHGNAIDKMERAKLNPEYEGKPNGIRYYSKLYAYQIGNKAWKNTGSRLIKIEDSPYTDADLRSGLFK